MKYSITLVLVVLTVVLAVGCSVNIPEVFNMDQPFLVVYHEPGTRKVYHFHSTRYPKLKAQIDDIIKNNQSGWRYYFEGILGESSPYIVVYVYEGSEQVAGMSIYRRGLLIARDYDKNLWGRHKEDEAGAKQLVKLIKETIEREDISPSQ